jgi:hypothetical protein
MRIVMGGAQRSGTSLLRSVLGSHSSVAFFPYDLKLWTSLRESFGSQDFGVAQNQSDLIAEILGNEKVVIAPDVPTAVEIFAALDASSSPPLRIEEVFDAFLRAYARKRGKPIWGLKTPWNEFYASDILEYFDDVVFVHLIRDPRQSALSAIYADGGSWFYDPALHVARWKKSAQLALENKQRFGNRYQVVKYEELAGDPKATVQSILPYFGLEYEQGMEVGDKQPGWDGSNSSFATGQGKKPARRPPLPPDLQVLYSRKLGAELTAFGYVLAQLPPIALIAGRLVGLLRMGSVFLLHRGIAAKRVLASLKNPSL